MTASRRVLVFGTANVNLLLSVARLPSEGETVLADDLHRALGGKGANQAVAAHRSAAAATFISSAAADTDGAWLREQLDVEGVSTVWLKGSRTGTAVVAVDHRGENQIIVRAADLPADGFDSATPEISTDTIVLVQREIGAEAVLEVLRAAARNGATTILNAAPADDLSSDELSLADYLIVNESEYAITFGDMFTSDVRAPAERPTTIVTLGSRGAALVTAEDVRFIPGHSVHAIDTVGAGDAFCGGFAASLAHGSDPQDAIRWAQAMAAITCTRHGAAPSIPTADEVQRFLQQREDSPATHNATVQPTNG